MNTSHKPHFIRPCTRVWLVLILFTCVTYAIGEAGLGGLGIEPCVIGVELGNELAFFHQVAHVDRT